MRQVSIRFTEVPDNSYPWSSIEEFDELTGVYYRATVMFPGKQDFERIYDVVYPEKLESFLTSSEYKNYIEECYYNEEGFNLPDRNKVQKIDIKMSDPEDIANGLEQAINKTLK